MTSANATRNHTLAVPLAMGVIALGAAAALFRPAYTVGTSHMPVVAAQVRPAAEANGPVYQQPAGVPMADGAAALPTGRSVDAPKLVLPVEDVERMVARGKSLIESGDFAAARLLLTRASDAGHSGATFALASTYDPIVLAARGARGLVGEPEHAKALYARAWAAGVRGARERIEALGG